MKLSKYDIARAKKFADARCTGSSSFYRSRGNFKYSDIVIGACGEIAAQTYLYNMGIITTDPDFTIHKRKSYDADLVHPRDSYPYEKHYHVKSQSTKQRGKPWEKSWLLQKNDPIVQCKQNNHYLVCCIVDLDTGEVDVLGTVPLATLHNKGLFKKPKKESLQATKVAIYWDDIIKSGGLK